MKKSFPTARLLAGFGLTSALLWGCMDPASSDKDNPVPAETQVGEGALALSIKDNPACREQWSAILNARSAGKADTGNEASFLANCVKEIKPAKDNTLPIIPSGLVPDSTSRCHWIVSQIDGGRNELTVTFKKYCPDDCRKLEDMDSTRHDKLCRDPHDPIPLPDPRKPILDSLYCDSLYMDLAKLDSNSEAYKKLLRVIDERCGVKPPRPIPNPNEDTCRMIREKLAVMDPKSDDYLRWKKLLLERCEGGHPPVDSGECAAIRMKLSMTKPGEPGRAELEKMLMDRCHDTLVHPIPVPNPDEDTCKMIRARLAGMDPKNPEYARWKQMLLDRCEGDHPPVDTSECYGLHLKLSMTKPGEPGRAELEKLYRVRCVDTDTVIVHPPKDTLPKPPMTLCDSLLKHLASLKVGTAEYGHFKEIYGKECPVPHDTVKVPPKDTLPKPPMTYCDSLLKKLASLKVGTADYARYKELAGKECMIPRDTVVVPPKDTLPKPVSPKVNCDELRAKLAIVDPKSADYARILVMLKENCPDVKPVVE